MNKRVKKESVDLPEEKKKSPLGKQPGSKSFSASNFAKDEQGKVLAITNVSA